MLQFVWALVIASTLTVHVYTFPTFHWPNPLLAYADKQLYEGPLDELVSSCSPRDHTTVSAQWLRLAYHDMSTHDVEFGTGGLDASIMYELDRPQNIGTGMAASLLDFNGFTIYAPFFGMADIIALGVVFAVAGCGGPLIPFSAGRVDATRAGPPTVPEPQQDLASHQASFRRQGFNETEMIALVACGHTLGGVRQADFPLVVTDTSIDVDTFDTTPAFDNTIISDYLHNITEDVLIIGPNITTRSDSRIFSSDGNVTMQRLLSTETFSDTCADVFQKMINTVPSTVNLTDPITEPFDYVINDPLLSYANGSFIMTTALRIMNANASTSVTMFWVERYLEGVSGAFCPPVGCSVQSSNSRSVSFSIIGQAQGYTASRYFFKASINANSSISNFWFEINDNDGVVADNGGSGFNLELASLQYFVDFMRSEFVFSSSAYYKIVVAIFGDATSTTASMTAFDPFSISNAPPFTPTLSRIELELDPSNPVEGGLAFFTANVDISVTFLDITVNGGGGAGYTIVNFDLSTAAESFTQVFL